VSVTRARGLRDKLSTSAVHLAGYFGARRRHRALRREASRLSLLPAITADAGSALLVRQRAGSL
jgi:hypothetical protein